MRRPSSFPSFEALVCACAVLGSSGCGGAGAPLTPEADSGTSSASSSTSTTAGSSTSLSTTALDDTGTHDTNATGVIFLIEPDFPPHVSCDVFDQDCPRGEKCTVWANDGGNAFNATKCVPVVDDPVGIDEVCHMERWPASGLDDCDFGAICLFVDTETLEGICMPLCVGDASNPSCEDPARYCPVFGNGAVIFCFSKCDPLEPMCLLDQSCFPLQDQWLCYPDASGDAGGYGDPCEFINVCDPGLICLNDDSVPPGEACEGAGGCCTELCDLTDPAGDLQCTGAPGGQTCQAWYGDGDAPPGLENVGVCAVPA